MSIGDEAIMKTLVVYYSFEGDSKFIGDYIAKEFSATVLELKLKKEVKNKDFMKNYLGKKQVLMKTEPRLQPYDVKFADYDLIIMGTPIWFGTFAPALRAFFGQEKIENKQIALFYCFAVKYDSISRHIRKALKGNTIVDEIAFKDPLKDDREFVLKKVEKWIAKLRSCIET